MDITKLVEMWKAGEEGALQNLFEAAYSELRRIAQNHLGSGASPKSLVATAMVHEAFIKISESNRGPVQNRAHFFAFASNILRSILVDYIKRKTASKRGGSKVLVSLPRELAGQSDWDLIDLDEALNALADLDSVQGRIVEMKFFGGLTFGEISQVLELSERTVHRKYKTAKIWLHRYLKKSGQP